MAIVALTLAVETETLLGRLAFGAAESAASVANSAPYIAAAGFGAYGLTKVKLHEKVNLRPDRFIPGRFKPKTEALPAYITPKKRPREELWVPGQFISPAKKGRFQSGWRMHGKSPVAARRRRRKRRTRRSRRS